MEVVLVFLSLDFFLSATPHSENRPVSGVVVWAGVGCLISLVYQSRNQC